MSGNILSTCPRCGNPLEQGFSTRAAGLSWVDPEKFEHWAFVDEDVSQAGLKKLLPSIAEYYRAYLCRSCRLYIVDYSETFSRHQAEKIAGSLDE